MKKSVIIMLLCLALLAVALSGCGTPEAPELSEEGREDSSGQAGRESPEEPPPEEALPEYNWIFDSPENHGMNGELLDSLRDALPGEIHSVVVVRDGAIVSEYYGEGRDETTLFRTASCTKGVTGALMGIAIQEGLIEGVDASIAAYFPQVADTGKEDITIRHLLEHTSGLEWHEWAGGTTNREMSANDHWVNFVLDRRLATTPGSRFNYSTGGSHLLSAILQEATGMPTSEYAREHLFAPMAINSYQWGEDPQGVVRGGSGLSLTARDLAKFGLLYLNGGRWEGEQLVPEAWVEESTSVQVARYDRSGSYGYQWWIQRLGGYDTFYAMGHGGQFVFVVPELNMVTAITSTCEDTYAPWPYYTDYILAACE